jgi:NADP-dependent 3-hydroxy acid dehydrogenase YdfG
MSVKTTASPIAGKAVVINGATTGIGRATAKLLVSHGARVLIFGRDENDLNEALREIKAPGSAGGSGEAFGLVGDVSNREDVERIFREADAKLGGVDVLINNAAIGGESLLEGSWDDWKYTLDVNVLGYFACARAALDRMIPKKEGHVLMVGSMSADQREPSNDIYAATKAAIQAFAEALRKNVNEKGIRVSLVEPGAVDTPIQEKPQAEKDRKKRKMEMLEPEDIARCLYYVLTQPKRCDVVTVQIRPLKQLI